MKTQKIILTILAAVLIAVPGSALAQSGPGYGPGGGGYGAYGVHHGGIAGGDGGGILRFFEHALPRLAERLELSDEQVADIQEILDTESPAIRELMEESWAERQEFHDNHSMGDFNQFPNEYLDFFENQAEAGVEIKLAVASTFAKVWEILTPEQRQQLEDMRGNFGKRSTRRGGGRRLTN